MAWTGASSAVSRRTGHPPAGLELNRLEAVVRALDPASRALLDLSLRRRMRDDDMAPLLRVDPFNVAWLRARAIERVASELGLDDAIGIGKVRAALPRLPEQAWGLPALPSSSGAPVGERPLADLPPP